MTHSPPTLADIRAREAGLEHRGTVNTRLKMADVAFCAVFYRDAVKYADTEGPWDPEMSVTDLVTELLAHGSYICEEWHEYFALAFFHLAAPHSKLVRSGRPNVQNAKDLLGATESLLVHRLRLGLDEGRKLPPSLDCWTAKAIEVADAALAHELRWHEDGDYTIEIFARVLARIDQQPTCTCRGAQ